MWCSSKSSCACSVDSKCFMQNYLGQKKKQAQTDSGETTPFVWGSVNWELFPSVLTLLQLLRYCNDVVSHRIVCRWTYHLASSRPLQTAYLHQSSSPVQLSYLRAQMWMLQYQDSPSSSEKFICIAYKHNEAFHLVFACPAYIFIIHLEKQTKEFKTRSPLWKSSRAKNSKHNRIAARTVLSRSVEGCLSLQVCNQLQEFLAHVRCDDDVQYFILYVDA